MAEKAQNTYCNPIWPDSMADPFVLKVRGRYYAYATEPTPRPEPESHIFPILTSTDLVHWQPANPTGKAMKALGPGYFFYWAPEVTEHNGQYYLYYAVHHDNEFSGSIRVAVANQPEGPFEDSGHDLTQHLVPWAIDPHVLRDDDGQWYLFVTIEYLEEKNGFVGSGNAVVRLLDPFTTTGPLTRVTAPAHQWQLFEAQRAAKNGIDWYTVEGPAVLKHRQRYYQMYSGGCYYKDNYAVSYAISEKPIGSNGLQDSSWQDWRGPQNNNTEAVLLRGKSGYLLGPGHNSVVVAPNNATNYIVYHAWQPDMTERRLCIDRLDWYGDMLATPAPTYTPQPAPTLPRLRELFVTDVLSSNWQQDGGSWQLEANEVIQQERTAPLALLHQSETLGLNWLLEINLRLIAGKGTYGVLLQQDAKKALALVIRPDEKKHQIQLELQQHQLHINSEQIIKTVTIPWSIDAYAWHQLLLTRSGHLLTVKLDGLEIKALETLIKHEPRTFALLTDQTSAAFSSISLTDTFRDEFLDSHYSPEQLDWYTNTQDQNWRIIEGALLQSNAVGEHRITKGQALVDFEYGVTLQARMSGEGRSAAYGIILSSKQQSLQVLLQQKQGEWYLALQDSNLAEVQHYPINKDFNPLYWHTLQIVQKDWLTITLDGHEIIQLESTGQPFRPGLITHEISAAFTGVWQIGLV